MQEAEPLELSPQDILTQFEGINACGQSLSLSFLPPLSSTSSPILRESLNRLVCTPTLTNKPAMHIPLAYSPYGSVWEISFQRSGVEVQLPARLDSYDAVR